MSQENKLLENYWQRNCASSMVRQVSITLTKHSLRTQKTDGLFVSGILVLLVVPYILNWTLYSGGARIFFLGGQVPFPLPSLSSSFPPSLPFPSSPLSLPPSPPPPFPAPHRPVARIVKRRKQTGRAPLPSLPLRSPSLPSLPVPSPSLPSRPFPSPPLRSRPP